MRRTQISLTDDQMADLRNLAVQRGESIAAVVRDAVERILADDAHRRHLGRALNAARSGAGRSGHHDVAREHDRHLADAFEA